MKTIRFLALLLIFSSCGGGKSVNPSSSYIRMTIAGKSFSTDGLVAIGGSFTDGMHNLSIVGTDKTFEGEVSTFSAIFSQAAEITPGTYVVGVKNGGASISPLNGKTYLQGSAPFTLRITETEGSGTTKKFKGTFSGQLVGPAAGDMVTITNGEFSSF